MGDGRNNLQRLPLYNVVNTILEQALTESGWSPLNKRQLTSHSPNPSSMDEELNGRLKVTINNNNITNKCDKPLHAEQRSVTFGVGDTAVHTYSSQPINGLPPASALSRKSIGEKRKERLLKEKQAAKNINNNYIHDLSNVSPNQSHSQVSPTFSLNNRKREIPEKIRLLTKQSLEETIPLIVLDGFEPSTTCTCEKPNANIRCRMCGAQVEINCFLHQAVGNSDTMVTRCSRPACSSEKLIVLIDI